MVIAIVVVIALEASLNLVRISRESSFGILSTVLGYFFQQGFEKSIIDLKDRLLRLIHASLDANLQSNIFIVIEVSLQLFFCAKP